MSAGNISVPNKNMHMSTSLNSRQQHVGTGNGNRMKSGSKKNQSSSVNPTERENTHKIKTFLDETS